MDSKDRQYLKANLKHLFALVARRYFQKTFQVKHYREAIPRSIELVDPADVHGYGRHGQRRVGLYLEAGYIEQIGSVYKINMEKFKAEAPAYGVREDICPYGVIYGDRPGWADVLRLNEPMLIYVYFHQDQYTFEKTERDCGQELFDELYVSDKNESAHCVGMFRAHINKTIKSMKPPEVLERVSGLLITGPELGIMVLRKSVLKEIADNAPVYAVRSRHMHHGCAKQYLLHPEYFTYESIYGGTHG